MNFQEAGAGLQNVHFWPVTKYLHLFLAPKVHKSQHILHHDKSALIATKVLKSQQKCANCRNVTTRLRVQMMYTHISTGSTQKVLFFMKDPNKM